MNGGRKSATGRGDDRDDTLAVPPPLERTVDGPDALSPPLDRTADGTEPQPPPTKSPIELASTLVGRAPGPAALGATTFSPLPERPLDRTLDRPVKLEPTAAKWFVPREVEADATIAADVPREERPVLAPDHQRIGRYAVLRKLGEGGMGEVYSAYDEELDRRVAIKLVRDRRAGDTLGQARMQREAQALARLSHPNVVQVYDVGTHDGDIFIAMEFVRGRTLTAWQESIDPATATGLRRILDMYIEAGRGLAAAHRRELVHRDFKPDNVLVGDDGRPRVLDFGLAAAADRRDESRAGAVEPAGVDMLSSDLTRTGSVMGTPAYMAPEQFLAERSDARTDQFSFCVALYGALYGELPFTGDTFAARHASVCAGVVQPAPAGARVPAWLRAILLRGLEVRPEERHSSMDALLAALSADPDEARRRRLRLAGLVAAVVAAVALVLWGGLAGWAAWQRHRVEVVAGERLAAMEAGVAALTAAGDVAEAERAFSAFVRLPEHRGTDALALAWRRRAEREAAAGRDDAAVDAYAASYAVAGSSEQEVAALAALARFFARRQTWDGLVQAIAALERRDPAAFAAPDLAETRLAAAVAGGDLSGAAALLADGSRPALRRIVDALTPARRTSWSAASLGVTAAVGAGELALFRGGEQFTRVRRDLDLTTLASHPTTLSNFVGLARGGDLPPLYVAHDPATREDVLLEPGPAGLAERLRWRDFPPLAALSRDLDGDGDPELLIGTGPYSRHLVELARDPVTGAWSTRQVAPMLDARRSDITSLAAGDLDGDGALEVVAGLGAWRAYEVHVLRRDRDTGLLATVARHKLGNNTVSLVGRGDGPPQIAAWKSDDDLNPTFFPPDRPRGAPSGLHLLRLVDDRLEETAVYPMPIGAHVWAADAMVADFDGDGRHELVARYSERDDGSNRSNHSTLIFVDEPGRGLVCLPLANVRPLAVADLDGDGDDELVVHDWRGHAVWVLGGGGDRLPPLLGRGEPSATDVPAADGAFARAWRQAAGLADMGLDAQAAAAFVDLADTVAAAEPRLAARALLRAGQLEEARGRDGAAAPLYARAAGDPELTEEAGLAAVRGYERLGERGQARAFLDGLHARPPALVELRRGLGDVDARIDLDFAAPLGDAWAIHQPLALVRDAPSASLHIDRIGGNVIAAQPITWPGGHTTLEVDLDLVRVEWGEDLRIQLVDGAGKRVLAIGASGRGGTGAQWVDLYCTIREQQAPHPIRLDLDRPEGPGRHVLRAVLDPARGEGSCTIRGADGREVFYHRLAQVPDVAVAPLAELQIDSGGSANLAGWVSADVRRISLVGVTPRPDDAATPLAAVRRTLVEGHLADALAGLDQPGALDGLDDRTRVRAGFWRISALARLGRLDEAAAALRPLLTDPALADAVAGPLSLLARTLPDVAVALLRSAGPPGMHRASMVKAWQPALQMRPRDILALQVLRRALIDLDGADGTPEELAEYFRVRGLVHAQLRMWGRARRDYGAALDHLRRITPADPAAAMTLHGREVGLAIDQATAAAQDGDLEAARAIFRRLLAVPEDSALVHDVLDVRPELAAVRGSL